MRNERSSMHLRDIYAEAIENIQVLYKPVVFIYCMAYLIHEAPANIGSGENQCKWSYFSN